MLVTQDMAHNCGIVSSHYIIYDLLVSKGVGNVIHGNTYLTTYGIDLIPSIQKQSIK